MILLGLFMIAFLPRAFGPSGWTLVILVLLIQFRRITWTPVNAASAAYRERPRRTVIWPPDST